MAKLNKYLEPYNMAVTIETILVAITCRVHDLTTLMNEVNDLETKQTLQLVIDELQEVQMLIRQIL